MDSGTDRGVSTVIGFIIIFSAIVISFSVYQGVIIPDQNRQAEFQHNERTQGQLLNLQDAVRRTGTTGVSQSVSIQVGVDYPDRTLGVNFATAGGRVRTVEPNPDGPNNITFENVRAVGSEVRDYWNSSDENSTLAFPTKDIVYRPSYTRYANAPETVLSNTAVFNQFDDTNLSIADQILIQGNRITIVAINGSLDGSTGGEGASVSVDTEPLSVATNSITVENDGTENITITVPTTVANESAWYESSLAEQETVEAITVEGSNLTITLENGTYSLRMAKVGVGSGTEDEDAEYIVPVDPPPRTVFNDTSHEVTVEVRDRFNNPNASTEVTATVVGNGSITPENGDNETDSNGQVTFNYTAPGSSADDTLVFNISGGPAGNADNREIVNHSVSVVENNGGGSSGGGGGGAAYTTQWYNPANLGSGLNANGELSSCSATDCTYDIGNDPNDNDLTLRGYINVDVEGFDVDFGVNDSSIGEPIPSTSETDANGNATTVLDTTSDGTVAVYAVSGGDLDQINISVISTPVVSNVQIDDDTDANGVVADGDTVLVTATVTDRPNIASVEANTGAFDAGTVTLNDDGPNSATNNDQYSATVPVGSSATDGDQSVTVNATDDAGTGGSQNVASGTLTVDTTPPSISDVTLVDDTNDDGIVGEGDSVLITARVTDRSQSAITSVTADASAFDAGSDTVTLNDDGPNSTAGNDFYSQTITVGPEAAEGDQSVTVNATDDAGNGGTQNVESGTVTVNLRGFQSANAFGILPSTSAQTQSFTFTPDTEIASGTDIQINLDDPQKTSPRQVDYQGSVNTNITTNDIAKNKNQDTASITITTGEPIAAGETVRVWIGGVDTGPTGQQTDPYDVVVTRGDSSDSITPTFEVARDTSNSKLTDLFVSNLLKNSNGQKQTIRFEPTSQISAGETLSIDLSDAQNTGTEVDYVNNGALEANVSVDTLEFSDGTADDASIRFIPTNNIAAGDTVQINITGVNTAGMGGAPYEVGFSRGDAGTASTTFKRTT